MYLRNYYRKRTLPLYIFTLGFIFTEVDLSEKLVRLTPKYRQSAEFRSRTSQPEEASIRMHGDSIDRELR